MKKSWQIIPNGSVALPEGFQASGMHAGIKANKRKYDCSLIVSDVPAVSAGVFTVNKAKAWPLLHDEKVISKKAHRAILANSGNANCFNGQSGLNTVKVSLKLLSKALKIRQDEIILASTGIIGRPFPIAKLKAAIPVLVKNLSKQGGHDAALGILTTDTRTKEVAVKFKAGGKTVSLAAMAKGSGMIYPVMTLPRHATMLCYFTTDLAITKPLLKEALMHATEKSFNRISIDNDMSTNDMVVVFANGLAKNKIIKTKNADFHLFQNALTSMCRDLAKGLLADGEGVQHVCEFRIKGGRNPKEVLAAGKQITTSMLVKTMFAGEDPNWGRLVAAIGSTGIQFSKKLDISFEGVSILKNGRPIDKNRSKVRKVLKKKFFYCDINLKSGKAHDTFLTTDLTKFYVWINASYSS